MIITIDTREQRPWSFPEGITIEVGTLKTGDYAIKGDTRFAIERKSADDFVGTVSSGWERFRRELNRMEESNFVAKVIIVEGDFMTFCFTERHGIVIPPEHEHDRCTPQFLMKRIAELALRGVCVMFAGDANLACAMALRLLFARQAQLDIEAQREQEKCQSN